VTFDDFYNSLTSAQPPDLTPALAGLWRRASAACMHHARNAPLQLFTFSRVLGAESGRIV
jgi:hypothetical protein